MDKKTAWLLLGTHHGVEGDLLAHFNSRGYVMHHAGTLFMAEAYVKILAYDVIFCFGKFADGQTTLDFVCSLDKSKALVIAMLGKEGMGEYRCRKNHGISHVFHVGTSPEIIRSFIDPAESAMSKHLNMAACLN